MIDKGEWLCVQKIKPPFCIKTMEVMEVMLTVWSKQVCLVTIYRPAQYAVCRHFTTKEDTISRLSPFYH